MVQRISHKIYYSASLSNVKITGIAVPKEVIYIQRGAVVHYAIFQQLIYLYLKILTVRSKLLFVNSKQHFVNLNYFLLTIFYYFNVINTTTNFTNIEAIYSKPQYF